MLPFLQPEPRRREGLLRRRRHRRADHRACPHPVGAGDRRVGRRGAAIRRGRGRCRRSCRRRGRRRSRRRIEGPRRARQDDRGGNRERAPALPGDQPQGARYAAWMFLHLGHPARAEAQARRTIELFTDSLQPYFVLGWSAWHRGRSEDAVDALEKALGHSREAPLPLLPGARLRPARPDGRSQAPDRRARGAPHAGASARRPRWRSSTRGSAISTPHSTRWRRAWQLRDGSPVLARRGSRPSIPSARMRDSPTSCAAWEPRRPGSPDPDKPLCDSLRTPRSLRSRGLIRSEPEQEADDFLDPLKRRSRDGTRSTDEALARDRPHLVGKDRRPSRQAALRCPDLDVRGNRPKR